MDNTETIRRLLVHEVNSQVESDDKATERARLEKKYGKVWNTGELTRDFHVIGFAAPFVVVREQTTGRKGVLMFQDLPRLYFGWLPWDVVSVQSYIERLLTSPTKVKAKVVKVEILREAGQ